MTMPMLVDFAARLCCGLAVALLGTPRREVPAAFLRTLCLVILGLMVTAALVWFTTAGAAATGGDRAGEAVVIATAALAFLASAAWGLGLPRLALPLTG